MNPETSRSVLSRTADRCTAGRGVTWPGSLTKPGGPARSGRRGAVLMVIVANLTAGSATVPAVALPSGTAVSSVAAGVSDRKRALDRELDELRETLEGTNKKLVEAAVNLRRAQAQLSDANAELSAARAALERARRRDAVLEEKLAVARAKLSKAERELDARREQEERTRASLGGIAREAYVTSGLSGLSIALEAENPAQFADRMKIAGTALRQKNGAIARLQVQQAETRARRARLKAAREQVAALKRESEQVVAERRRAEEASASAAAEVERLVEVKASSVKAISARKAAERRRVAKLEGEQARLAKLLRSNARSAQRGGRGFNNGSGRLSYPVNAPVTSGFGYRYHPILHYSRLHAGTDFGASCGTPVHAAAPGRVVRAGRAGGYGNQVVLAHGRMKGKDIATSYNHLSRIVARGGAVERGQVVGYVGTTGLSTGCHLHFEVYANGTHVNPMSWL